MSTKSPEKSREVILKLLEGLRQDYLRGSLKLYKEYLDEDAVYLGVGDQRIHKGKESCLEYLRASAQKGGMRAIDVVAEDIKFIGDVAIVVETYTTKYDIKGESFRDTGRGTQVLINKGGHWYATHIQLERLATNRVIP